MMAPTLQETLERIEKGNIKNVRFEFLDYNGIARSKTIPARHCKELFDNGILFPVVPFATNCQFDFLFESDLFKKYLFSDVAMLADLSTFAVLPWVKTTARVFVTGSTHPASGVDIMLDPRAILQRQIEELSSRGLSIFSAYELEFWVVHKHSMKPVTDDVHFFATLRLAEYQQLFDRITESLFEAGVDITCMNTEYDKGQFEITMKPGFGVRGPDNAATVRTGIKEMAAQEEYLASFMTKPFEDRSATAAHLNHSLWSVDGKTSKMGDPTRPHGLSEVAEYWIAGILAHAPAVSFLMSPTLNCLHRFHPGTLAPFNATWGIDNRSCAIRVKMAGSDGVYLENRIGSSGCNPYIGLAATIAAGMDGIDRKLTVPPPQPTARKTVEEDGYVLLPSDMESALDALKSDDVISKAVGADMMNALELIRRSEEKHVSEGSKYEDYRKLYFKYL